jgi:hypothetical protein
MQGATKPDISRSRRLARILAANPRAAIYGTIVASAVIATTAGGHESAELILEATLATLVVFWLAHVYADFLGHGLRRARSDLRFLASIMVQELSMLVAPALSILFLLLGALGMLEEALAVGLALWNGVVQLVGWGIGAKQAWQAPGGHDRHAVGDHLAQGDLGAMDRHDRHHGHVRVGQDLSGLVRLPGRRPQGGSKRHIAAPCGWSRTALREVA